MARLVNVLFCNEEVSKRIGVSDLVTSSSFNLE